MRIFEDFGGVQFFFVEVVGQELLRFLYRIGVQLVFRVKGEQGGVLFLYYFLLGKLVLEFYLYLSVND